MNGRGWERIGDGIGDGAAWWVYPLIPVAIFAVAWIANYLNDKEVREDEENKE